MEQRNQQLSNRTENRSLTQPDDGGMSGQQHSHFLVECETRVVEIITNPVGRTTLLLRRSDVRTFPKDSYIECERDFEKVRGSISDLDIKADSESLTGWERQKQAA